MSQRTIVEFNHDKAYGIEDSTMFIERLCRALRSGDDRYWEDLEQYGIKKVAQLHHSSNRKLVTDYKEYNIG